MALPSLSIFVRWISCNLGSQDLRQLWRRRVAYLAPRGFDVTRDDVFIWKGLKPLYFGNSEYPIAPVRRAHVVGAAALNGPSGFIRRSQLLDCGSNLEPLEDKDHAATLFSAISEWEEVSRHCADVVGNEHSPLCHRQRQRLGDV